MTLRKVPGAVALGLLASLAAHAALYGDGHAMGGAYHAMMIQAALYAVVSLIVFFGALAWSATGVTADGSVVATRLRDRLPPLEAIIAFAGVWYAFAEAVEPQHAGASPFLAVALLALCSWLVLRLSGAVASAIGAALFAVRNTPFAPRVPSRARRPQRTPLLRRPLLARRRFARPPPIVAALRA